MRIAQCGLMRRKVSAGRLLKSVLKRASATWISLSGALIQPVTLILIKRSLTGRNMEQTSTPRSWSTRRPTADKLNPWVFSMRFVLVSPTLLTSALRRSTWRRRFRRLSSMMEKASQWSLSLVLSFCLSWSTCWSCTAAAARQKETWITRCRCKLSQPSPSTSPLLRRTRITLRDILSNQFNWRKVSWHPCISLWFSPRTKLGTLDEEKWAWF